MRTTAFVTLLALFCSLTSACGSTQKPRSSTAGAEAAFSEGHATDAPGDIVDIAVDPNVIFGLPATSKDVLVLQNVGYSVGYSPETRTPLWVAYRLVGTGEQTPGKRPSTFRPDPRVSAPVRHADYDNSGYDRGHMAPNAPVARRYGESAQLATFLTTNIAPQLPGLNQRGWEALENIIGTTWAPAFEEVWVFVGPIFEGECWQLRSGVRIPSDFYMIVVDIDEETGDVHALAVVMEHRRIDREPLEAFVTTVEEVQARTGIDFLHELEDSVEAAVESAPPDARWNVEQELVPRFAGNARPIDRVRCDE